MFLSLSSERILSYGDNNLDAITFFPHPSCYKEKAVRIEVARAVCYDSFYFVNNKSHLCNVSVIFFCFVVNFSIVHVLFRLVTF